MVKILYVYGDVLRLGGIEMFMMNHFRRFDREKVQVDFAIQGTEESAFEDEILAAGSKLYRLPKPGKHPIAYREELKKILRSGEYDVVHAHCDAMDTRIMYIAKHCGIGVRIAHSHSTDHINLSKKKLAFYELSRKLAGTFATERWACSEAAGKWLFGAYPFEVIPNAIETEKFAFSPADRSSLRERFGISENEIVLGHVGGFHTHKNHAFMLEVLKLLRQRGEKKYRLLFVGDGGLRAEIEKKAVEMGLSDMVSFAGAVADVEKYYSAMDLFLLPSLFEGYGMVIAEACANGLSCLVSDRVTREAGVGENVRFLELDAAKWADAILKLGTPARHDVSDILRGMGMDIAVSAQCLEEKYIKLYNSVR